MQKKVCYVVYYHNYSGESECLTFWKKEDAHKEMIADMKNVIKMLEEDGYKSNSCEHDDSAEVFASNGNIYYEWEIFESSIA